PGTDNENGVGERQRCLVDCMEADGNWLEHGSLLERQCVRHPYQSPGGQDNVFGHGALAFHAGNGHTEHLPMNTTVDRAFSTGVALSAVNRRIEAHPLARNESLDLTSDGMDDT